jgi:NADH-quinone oxidoreductase subunit N
MSLAEKIVMLTYMPALIAAVVALALDTFGRRRLAVWMAASGALVSAGAAGWGVVASRATNAWDVLAVGAGFSAIGSVVFFLALASVAGGSDWFTSRPHGGSWAALIVLAAVGASAAATSVDFVGLLVSLEVLATCSYALVTASRNRRADEAAMKYFIQGAVVTGVIVLALAPIIGIFAPDGSYATLGHALAGGGLSTAALLGGMLLTAALAFKTGAVPFHSWAPDAYETAPPVVSAFLATGPKLAGIGALGVLGMAFSTAAYGERLSIVLSVLAVLSILVGSIAALGQKSYTRMLGYAGIAQVGYALVALAAGYLPSAILFVVGYSAGSAATFLAADAFKRVRPEWDGTIAGLAGLGRKAPLLSLGVSVALASLAGIPPLLGFWGKFWAFGAAVQNGYLWLALVAIAGSIVSVAYYGSVLRALYIDVIDGVVPDSDALETGSDAGESGSDTRPTAGSGGGSAGVAVVVLAALSLVIGLLPLALSVASLLVPFAIK